jgi:hypothetical protein
LLLEEKPSEMILSVGRYVENKAIFVKHTSKEEEGVLRGDIRKFPV